MINVIVNHTAKVIFIVEEDSQVGFNQLEGNQPTHDNVDLFAQCTSAKLASLSRAYPGHKVLSYRVKPARYVCTITFTAHTEAAIVQELSSTAAMVRENGAILQGETARHHCVTRVTKGQWGEPILELQED